MAKVIARVLVLALSIALMCAQGLQVYDSVPGTPSLSTPESSDA